MTNEAIIEILKNRYADLLTLPDLKTNLPTAQVAKEQIVNVSERLKRDPELQFDYLIFLGGTDYPPDHIDIAYLLSNFSEGHKLLLKTTVPREKPELDSVTSVWPGANWHEREAYDLLGVIFHHHPDLRRIFCDGVTEGHPHRKDYTDEDYVHMPEPTIIMPAIPPKATPKPAAATKPADTTIPTEKSATDSGATSS